MNRTEILNKIYTYVVDTACSHVLRPRSHEHMRYQQQHSNTRQHSSNTRLEQPSYACCCCSCTAAYCSSSTRVHEHEQVSKPTAPQNKKHGTTITRLLERKTNTSTAWPTSLGRTSTQQQQQQQQQQQPPAALEQHSTRAALVRLLLLLLYCCVLLEHELHSLARNALRGTNIR